MKPLLLASLLLLLTTCTHPLAAPAPSPYRVTLEYSATGHPQSYHTWVEWQADGNVRVLKYRRPSGCYVRLREENGREIIYTPLTVRKD